MKTPASWLLSLGKYLATAGHLNSPANSQSKSLQIFSKEKDGIKEDTRSQGILQSRLGRLRQEAEFKASLSYLVRAYLKVINYLLTKEINIRMKVLKHQIGQVFCLLLFFILFLLCSPGLFTWDALGTRLLSAGVQAWATGVQLFCKINTQQ